MYTFMAILIVILIIIAFIAKIYNSLQTKMQTIREQYSNIQARLKKRNDLTSQIINIASSYAKDEQLTHISLGANSLSQVGALAQDYPELKANETYQTLMKQLESLEQDILVKRETYNRVVKDYNSYRNSIPQVFVASKLSFDIVSYFDIEDEDFSENLQTFKKDDSVGLQDVLNKSSEKISNLAQNAKKSVEEKLKTDNKQKED